MILRLSGKAFSISIHLYQVFFNFCFFKLVIDSSLHSFFLDFLLGDFEFFGPFVKDFQSFVVNRLMASRHACLQVNYV